MTTPSDPKRLAAHVCGALAVHLWPDPGDGELHERRELDAEEGNALLAAKNVEHQIERGAKNPRSIVERLKVVVAYVEKHHGSAPARTAHQAAIDLLAIFGPLVTGGASA